MLNVFLPVPVARCVHILQKNYWIGRVWCCIAVADGWNISLFRALFLLGKSGQIVSNTPGWLNGVGFCLIIVVVALRLLVAPLSSAPGRFLQKEAWLAE